jgi:hypothetical protein
MKNLATALVKAQSEMSNPTKGNTNPFFKSKYADLNAVREAVIPVLNENGISVLQPLVNINGKNFVNTILLHESGEMMESFTEIIYNKQNDAQAQGSGITYARRYGLQSFVCVGADDDDGNSASAKAPTIIKKEDVERLNIRLKSASNLEELGTVYKSFSPTEQSFTKSFATELKEKLTLKTA